MASAVPAETPFSSSIAGFASRSAWSASASIDGLSESFVCSRSMNARGVRPLVSKSIGWARSARTAVSSFSVRPKRMCGAVSGVGAVGSELGEVVFQFSAVGFGERAAGQAQLVVRCEDADDLVAGGRAAAAFVVLWVRRPGWTPRIWTCSIPMPASSCSHSWGAVICTPRSVTSSSSIGGPAAALATCDKARTSTVLSQAVSHTVKYIICGLRSSWLSSAGWLTQLISRRNISWLVPSRCSLASGPICRWKTCAARRATSATRASSWRAGAITLK